jgi:hypothetical protein
VNLSWSGVFPGFQRRGFCYSSAEVAPFLDFFMVVGSCPFWKSAGREVVPTAAAVLFFV